MSGILFFHYMWVNVATLSAVAFLTDTATILFLRCQGPIL